MDTIARFASRRVMLLVIAVAVAAIAVAGGVAASLDRAIAPLRTGAAIRPASGRVVLVEMDAASAAAIQRWPWPRANYARVVDRLRAAGAASITFDVDFSSSSIPADDAAFARSLARANGLVALPTFAQRAASGEMRVVDALPLPMLRDHVALASVSIAPDFDGIVRRAPLGTVTAGVPRPSLSAYIAHRSGVADASFPIDYSVDPDSIPRLSFIAVRDGRFDPRVVRGRDILIGATAIEMGDRYATPHWGVVPGVTVQALAAETLIRGVPVEGSALLVILVAMLLAVAVLRVDRGWRIATGALATPVALFAAAVLAQAAWGRVYPLAPGLIVLAVVALGRVAVQVTARFEEQQLVDEQSGLPNRRALLAQGPAAPGTLLVVAQLANLDPLIAVLGDAAAGDVVRRVAERLAVGAAGPVHRLSDRLLAAAWTGAGDLDDEMAGLRQLMVQPVEVLGRRVDASVFVGVSADASLDRAVNAATRAAEEAAAAGLFWRNGSTDLAALERDVALMGELDQAIEAGEIEVHYQPKLGIASDRVVSVEALVRWRHTSLGFVGPEVFVPLAERTGRIAPLTLLVIERTLDALAAWRRSAPTFTAAVNISATLVTSPAFDRAARALLDRARVPASALIFEVTESAALGDPDAAAAMLCGYRELGIAISMDDYGTGQSTLSYLQRLPLAELKIDRSFVQNAHRSRTDGLMVRSTVDLAHALGLKVVAEGVEEEECLAFLRSVGCDMAQGYLIGRPVRADAVSRILTSRREAA